MPFALHVVGKNIFAAFISTSAPTPAYTISTRTATKATATITQLPIFADEDNNGSLLGRVDDADDLMLGIDMDSGSGAGHSSALTLATTPTAVLVSVAAPLAPLVTPVEDHYAALARQLGLDMDPNFVFDLATAATFNFDYMDFNSSPIVYPVANTNVNTGLNIDIFNSTASLNLGVSLDDQATLDQIVTEPSVPCTRKGDVSQKYSRGAGGDGGVQGQGGSRALKTARMDEVFSCGLVPGLGCTALSASPKKSGLNWSGF
jgi:hypothetical protein